MSGPRRDASVHGPGDWLTWRGALDAMLARCEPLATERVTAMLALGRAAAEDVLWARLNSREVLFNP